MGVSVVVPCLNEEKHIAACLQSLVNKGNIVSDYEILVVDGGSTDQTKQIVQKFQKDYPYIQWINNPHKKTPFALNLGIAESRFEFILIAGAHATYPDSYVTRLINHLQNPAIDVVGGRIQTKVMQTSKTAESIRFVLSDSFGVGNSAFRIGASKLQKVDTVPFGMYRKNVLNTVGLYNEKLTRNQDIELSKRILSKGFTIWLDPELTIDYYARETYNQLAVNNFWNGFWNLKTIYITKDFKSLSLRHYIPLLFFASLVFPLLTGIFYKPSLFIPVFSFSSYVMLMASISLWKQKYSLAFHTLFAFMVLHFSYGAGSFIGLFTLINKNG